MAAVWVLLEPCNWGQQLPTLAKLQAIGDARRAVNQSASAADEQVRLIEVVKEVSAALQSRSDTDSTPAPDLPSSA